MNITGWPFLTITDTLQIGMDYFSNSATGNECSTTETTLDESNNLQTIKIELNGVELYHKEC